VNSHQAITADFSGSQFTVYISGFTRLALHWFFVCWFRA